LLKLLIRELSHVERFLEISALLVCNIKSIVNSITFHGVPLRVLPRVSNIRVVDVPGISILHLERCLVEKLMRLTLVSLRSMWMNNFKRSVNRRLWNAVVLEVHESPSLTKSELRRSNRDIRSRHLSLALQVGQYPDCSSR